MKSRPRKWLWLILLLLAGCVPVDPPIVDPPVLTMKQQQKRLMAEYKRTGHMPRGSGYFVLVADKETTK